MRVLTQQEVKAVTGADHSVKGAHSFDWSGIAMMAGGGFLGAVGVALIRRPREHVTQILPDIVISVIIPTTICAIGKVGKYIHEQNALQGIKSTID